MIMTLHPYSNTAKTVEIMSRYRPIAPKPEVPDRLMNNDNSSMSQKIKQSPYLRNLWQQLQARPTRTRKRGRTTLPPTTLKRPRIHVFGLSSPSPVESPAKNLSLQGFAHGLPRLSISVPNLAATVTGSGGGLDTTRATSSLVTLPLPPCSPAVPVAKQATAPEPNCLESPGEGNKIDLNRVVELPEEKDLLLQLRGPTLSSSVIAPQPVRPVGSSISVRCISEDPGLTLHVQFTERPEEVEEEVESDTLPAVISDSNNKERLANSAYKEIIGQPECPWLNSMVTTDGKMGRHSCDRISREIMLHLSDSRVPVSSNGFSCWVRIKWRSKGNKHSINTFCDAIKLSCQSRDYLFTGRFHTDCREASQSTCND
ncbi:hypothetical protein SLEP1_g30230 [Rubroshorea leprosula]|uniref:DUF7950 domain-containing protein n=1 Tax=Rubroshorea leprosula TaxID=152421 RepID=A0AAV5K5P5_9ROSI|nr:hypothetical protein SLEP1_g30230 [Rubroshorea leprosula]